MATQSDPTTSKQRLFDANEIRRGDRVRLRFTGERVPAKLGGSWATVDRGLIPASRRIRVCADSETDYPRRIELSEIECIERAGVVIAKRVAVALPAKDPFPLLAEQPESDSAVPSAMASRR